MYMCRGKAMLEVAVCKLRREAAGETETDTASTDI